MNIIGCSGGKRCDIFIRSVAKGMNIKRDDFWFNKTHKQVKQIYETLLLILAYAMITHGSNYESIEWYI